MSFLKLIVLNNPAFNLDNISEIKHINNISELNQTDAFDNLVLTKQDVAKLITNEQEQYLKSSTHQGVQLIPLSKIIYCTAEDKYVVVKYGTSQALVTDSLSQLETAYPDIFIRIHRNTIIVKNKILSLEKQENNKLFAVMNTGQKLAVSRRREPAIRQYLKSR